MGFESYIDQASAWCLADPECRGNVTTYFNVTGGGGDEEGRYREVVTQLLNQLL